MSNPLLIRARTLLEKKYDAVFAVAKADELFEEARQHEGAVPFDLAIGSPPYAGKAFRYGNEEPFPNEQVEWAKYMKRLTVHASQSVNNWIVWVVNDPVIKGVWHPAVSRLEVMLHDAGMLIDRSNIWHKNAPPNRKDFFGNDYEKIIMVRCGADRYFDGLKVGTPPKYKSGGQFRQRNSKGKRVMGSKYPQNPITRPRDVVETTSEEWRELLEEIRSNLQYADNPEICDRIYEVLKGVSDVVRATVGGGHMGDVTITKSASPYPMNLIRKRLPVLVAKGGYAVDCFNGAGTSCYVSFENGVKYFGSDVDESMIEMTADNARAKGMKVKVLDR